VQAIIQEFQE
jgi:hypothetical protein